MEIGNIRINKLPGEHIHFYFLGDVHEGNVNHDEKALRTAVKMIETDENARVILMGDMIEAITHRGDNRFDPITIAHKYEIRDLKDLPWRQMSVVIERLEPIKEKVDAIIVGNHEESYIKYNSNDIYDRFCRQFPKAKKLGRVGFMNYIINIRADGKRSADYTIKIALNHGDGGRGELEGYPINVVHKVFKYMYADINVMGHIHNLAEDRKPITTITSRGKLVQRIRYWGVSGCFFRTYVEGNRSYYEHKAGRKGDSDVGMLMMDIELHNKNWRGEMKKIYL